LPALLQNLRAKRWANLLIVNLRILLGFAFLPAGLKKVLREPFTDPGNVGAFHDFLHAFHATGFFYQFVGFVQLTVAVLLMTQTFAALGALMALPMFTAITVFCWSTAGIFTTVMVTLMLLGTGVLLWWDNDKWRGVLRLGPPEPSSEDTGALVDIRLWQRCGIAILALYFGICAWSGGVYRPRGVELDNPAFYALPFIALFPLVTLAVERIRRR
jgi:uncharacterized membrane protein YphA (DoxX/SURF4 family)